MTPNIHAVAMVIDRARQTTNVIQRFQYNDIALAMTDQLQGSRESGGASANDNSWVCHVMESELNVGRSEGKFLGRSKNKFA